MLLRLAKYLPLLLVCFFSACSDEPSQKDLLAEVKESNTSLGVYIFYGLKDTSSLRSSLSSTIVLMKNGNDVDSSQLNGAMVTAAALNAEKTLKFLVSKGADVNWSMSGVRALPCAIFAGNLELADWLLNNGASKDAGNITPLMAAVYVYSLPGENRDRALASIQFLLRRYASVSGGDGRENPLIFASSKGYKELVELFLKSPDGHRAMLDRDKEGRTALLAAVEERHADIAKLLIETYGSAKVLVNIEDKHGYTPLLIAASRSDKDLVKYLIDAGANLKAVDKEIIRQVLFHAVYSNNVDIVKSLIELGADVDAKNKYGDTPLIWAAYKNNTDIAALLIEKGANVDAKDNKGWTPLIWTAFKNNADVAKLLIDAGANLNGTNDGEIRWTPLRWAMSEDSVDVAKLLVKAGASVYAGGNRDETPLKIAVDKRDLSYAKLLIDAGADPNAKDEFGDPLLFSAVKKHDVGMVALLLKAGADPNAKNDKYDITPLKEAMFHHYDTTVAKLLIEHGADISTEGTRGRLIRWAMEKNDKDLARVLEEYENEEVSPSDYTKQSEEKGVPLPGYGTTTKSDDALKGILIDLSHARPQKKGLHTPSSSREKEEQKSYESRESQSKRLRNSIQSLSTTWNIEGIKDRNPVSRTTLYTTSIYISDNGDGFSYGSRRAVSGSIPCYLCYYEGHFGVPDEGDYRFVGYAESVMLVGVDLTGAGKNTQTVLYAFKPQQGFGACVKCGKDWEPVRFCGPSTGNDGEEVANSSVKLYKGSWLHLVPDKRYFIRIAFGTLSERMQAQLGIQKKGRDTDDNFPLFTLEKVRFPVYHRRYPGAGYTTLESRETGQYNSTCVFTPPQEQPTPTTKKTLSTGTTKRKTSSKPSQTTQSRGNS